MEAIEEEWKRKVFRLRGLPSNVLTSAQAEHLVASTFGDLSAADIHIGSLATSLEWENPPSKTATLQFKVVPNLILPHLEGKEEWDLSGWSSHERLTLDCHFLGFTPLNDVDKSTLHTVEYDFLLVWTRN